MKRLSRLRINTLTTIIYNTHRKPGSYSTNILFNNYRTELDSHADTRTVGYNTLITHTHEINSISEKVNNQAFDTKLEIVEDIIVVNAALAYVCSHTDIVIILKANQAIHITTMEHNLLCIIQMKLNDITIEEYPKFLTENPSRTSHAMVI